MKLCLSMTGRCNFDCLYCPKNRGGRLRFTDMEISTLDIIIEKFKDQQVDWIELGENGEFFMHRQALLFAMKLKHAFPKATFSLYSNFSKLDESTAELIISQGLVDRITTNRNDLKRSLSSENLFNFIQLRDQYNSPISISVAILTNHRYVNIIKKRTGQYPKKYCPDEHELLIPDELKIVSLWQSRLSEQDKIYIPGTFAWAERGRQIDLKGFCPILNNIKNSIYIAPNGNIYPCCYDSDYNITLGNIRTDSLDLINERRLEFFTELEQGIYDRYPCTENWSCISEPGYVIS